MHTYAEDKGCTPGPQLPCTRQLQGPDTHCMLEAFEEVHMPSVKPSAGEQGYGKTAYVASCAV